VPPDDEVGESRGQLRGAGPGPGSAGDGVSGIDHPHRARFRSLDLTGLDGTVGCLGQTDPTQTIDLVEETGHHVDDEGNDHGTEQVREQGVGESSSPNGPARKICI
jgi:hypothetical protein